MLRFVFQGIVAILLKRSRGGRWRGDLLSLNFVQDHGNTTVGIGKSPQLAAGDGDVGAFRDEQFAMMRQKGSHRRQLLAPREDDPSHLQIN